MLYFYRIKHDNESLFKAKELPPIEFKAREYCSCEAELADIPYGLPNYVCNLTSVMKPCRVETQSVFYAPCKRQKTYERRKRSLEYIDDEEPEDIELPLNDTNSEDVSYIQICLVRVLL